MTHVRLAPVRSASIVVHFGRLHRLSQRDRVRLVLFIHFFTIIVLWLVMLEIKQMNKFLWKPIKRNYLKIYCIKYEDGNALFTLVLKIIWSIVLKQKDETGMCKYQKAGPRLEHFKWVDNPLIVWAQERANVLAWRVAKPLSYTRPAPLLTDHLKPPFICHILEHKPMLQFCQLKQKKQNHLFLNVTSTHFILPTFDRL